MPKRNITYLLGAGASWHSLPLINEFEIKYKPDEERYSFSLEFFNEALYNARLGLSSSIRETLGELDLSARHILQGLRSGEHSTIDTWAKKSLIQGNESNLKKIKDVTNIYLSSLEYLHGNDPRYETFFANILSQGQNSLPSNLKFLSWNYDRQIQSSLMRVIKDKSLISYNTPLNRESISDYVNSKNLLKINGELNCFSDIDVKPRKKADVSERIRELPFIIRRLLENNIKDYGLYDSNQISYAWNDEIINNRFDSSPDVFKCQMLIIIGYSFPDSNRKIDVGILSRMSSSLQQIVIQDPFGENILDKLQDVFEGARIKFGNDSLRIIKNCDNFYIPNDLLY